MATSNRQKGIFGEHVCQHYLQKLGYKIVAKNWYCHWGELDLIAIHERQLVFIEVKTVFSTDFCDAVDLFNYKKRRKLTRTINQFLARYRLFNKNWRLDLACITKDGPKIWLEHYKNVLCD